MYSTGRYEFMSVGALVEYLSVEPVSGMAVLVLVAARFTAHAATKRQEDQNLSANVRRTAFGLALKYWSGPCRTYGLSKGLWFCPAPETSLETRSGAWTETISFGKGHTFPYEHTQS